MIFPLTVDRILADRFRAEFGRSVLTVAAPTGTHFVLGGHDPQGSADGYPIGVYAVPPPTAAPRAHLAALQWLRTGWRLRAAAFHPTVPLLVLGTGSYDGGYFFEGEVVLLDLATGEHRHLFEEGCRREVRSLEWTDAHTLRILLAPYDDWEDRAAWLEGHRVDLVRPDWRTVPAHSVRHTELTGPRVPASLPEPAPALAAPDAEGPRPGEIRSLTVLPDGDILLTADHVLLERWSARGERRWSVPADPDLGGGRTAVALPEGDSAWVEALGPSHGGSGTFLRIALSDGTERGRRTTPGAASLVSTSEGPLLVPTRAGYGERARSLFRHSPHAIFRDVSGSACVCDCPWDDDEDCDCRCTCPACAGEREDAEVWLTVVATRRTGRPVDLAFPAVERCRRVFPWSWEPGETHVGGPGVGVGETDLVMATVRHDGRVGPPVQGFVARRSTAEGSTGAPSWVFPVDRTPTALDIDPATGTVFVALGSGELIALEATTGRLLARGHVPVRGAPVIPTAVTVAGPGRILLGTCDGRVLIATAR
ncbi:PQQ-binding-like beta-propeller repeat protein [Streptomyces globisporus]|uniref:Uncharacterized protein n=1 Tax=Streptomyces globisporus TaxID=1908 RepID=A0A423V1U4_STRGL|nr:PQQ-binding-like beta-propeller repeat protein [Streptomyces globisporus]ROV68527.1 hypothetical protein D3105_10875 [Streptomyces globisporus]